MTRNKVYKQSQKESSYAIYTQHTNMTHTIIHLIIHSINQSVNQSSNQSIRSLQPLTSHKKKHSTSLNFFRHRKVQPGRCSLLLTSTFQ